jgi:hypothetical protein
MRCLLVTGLFALFAGLSAAASVRVTSGRDTRSMSRAAVGGLSQSLYGGGGYGFASVRVGWMGTMRVSSHQRPCRASTTCSIRS